MPLVVTVDHKLPVDITYTCGKCGKSYTVAQYVVVTHSAPANNNDLDMTEKILREKLPSDWKQQV